MMFNLLSQVLGTDYLFLNEPREIYMNADIGFDIWSKKASESVESVQIALAKPHIAANIINYLANDYRGYIEKMPEHIFRVSDLLYGLP